MLFNGLVLLYLSYGMAKTFANPNLPIIFQSEGCEEYRTKMLSWETLYAFQVRDLKHERESTLYCWMMFYT